MKGCADVRDMIHPFVDGELEISENVALLKHLELCGPCRSRCEEERALKGLVGSCLEARLSEVERSRILTGAFARHDRSEWRERLIRVAAVLAIVAGLGMAGLAATEPCLFKPCPTQLALEAAFRAADEAPRSMAEVASEFPREVCVPQACNLEVAGFTLVSAPGSAPRPMVRYRCQKTGRAVAFIHVPSQHRMCFHRQEEHQDGRLYVTVAEHGKRAVAWYGKDGELRACLAPEEVPEDDLYVMASAVRDGEF